MIDERKMKAIELRCSGKSSVEIAKIVGVSRTSIWNWFNEDEVKAELARFEREIKTHAQNRFNAKADVMIDKAYNLALNATSEKVNADMTQYWIDRIMGKTTTKIENNDSKSEEGNVSDDILKQEFNEVDNE